VLYKLDTNILGFESMNFSHFQKLAAVNVLSTRRDATGVRSVACKNVSWLK